MALNEKIIFSCLDNLKCFEANPHIAVGVSGGPDSMALIFLLKKWIKEKKGKLTALIYDHSIRSNSKNEALQVMKILKSFEIEAKILSAKKNYLIKKNMAQARDNRFNSLIQYCHSKKILHLFLGHHADDNLETFLIRRVSGSNLEGLNSINYLTSFEKIQILRPLIKINKISILNYNKKNKIQFINDPSNTDVSYTRVKVRNFLRDQKFKKIVKKDFKLIRKQIPNYKKMIWELLVSSIVDIKNSKVKININLLLDLDDLIIEKHILILLKYFSFDKYKTKSSKIHGFINSLKKKGFKQYNLSGIIIKKNSGILEFSKK